MIFFGIFFFKQKTAYEMRISDWRSDVCSSDLEGLANVWVEALACGTPIVISDAGGAREGLDRPEAGRIVPREPSAITRAICDILADPPAPAVVRSAAARFSWGRNARELREHLGSLVRPVS